jgi:hypothetical protein
MRCCNEGKRKMDIIYPRREVQTSFVPTLVAFFEMQYAVKAEKDGMDPSRRSGQSIHQEAFSMHPKIEYERHVVLTRLLIS